MNDTTNNIVDTALNMNPDEAFSLFIEAAGAHRAKAIRQGFSPRAAEKMAIALHAGLVALYFTQVGGEEPI